MMNNGSAGFSDKPARIISILFHPLLMPVYGMAIIFSAPTLYTYIPFEVKRLVILIVLVNNVLLPLSLLPFFIHSRMIGSWSMDERQDRVIPLIINTMLYIVTSYILFRFTVPHFLKSYIMTVGLLSLVATLINLRWKISLYSMGAGLLLSVVIMLSVKMYTPLIWYIIAAGIAAGFVLSSRLQLNYHNPGQVWCGFFAGLLGFSLLIMLFY
jgi:hypothetical protein